MLGLGLLVARWVTPAADDRCALVWGFPARNVAVAVLIATAVIGQAKMAAFVAVLFATQLALLIPFGLSRRRRPGGIGVNPLPGNRKT